MKIYSEFRGKHHFQIEENKFYVLDFPAGEELGDRYEACKKIAEEMRKALEEQIKKEAEAKEEKAKEETKEVKDDKAEDKN